MYTYTFSIAFFIIIARINANIYSSDVINGIKKTPVEGQDIITWCTTSLLEQAKCEKLARSVMQDKGLFGKDYIELQCIRAFDTEECMNWVDRGEASLLGLDAGEVYVAGRYHSLVPILQELYGKGEPYQYSIAVVRKGGLPGLQPGYGLHALRGAKACFPGVGALAGWVMPIHVLMQRGGLKIIDCNNHVKSTIAYFGESCAPNSLKDMYNPIGDNSDKLCRLCTGGTGIRCTLADPYAGYEGALRCLIANNSGEIAFVRDTTVQHALLSHTILGGVREDQFELICMDGSRRPVTDSENCNWGRVPADAIVTSSAVSMEQRKKYQNLFQTMYQLYGEPNSLNKNYNLTNIHQTNLYNPYSTTDSSRYPYDSFNSDKYNYNKRQSNDDIDRSNTMPQFKPRVDSAGQLIEPLFQLFHSNETTDLLLQDATVNFRILREDEQAAKHIVKNKYVGEQAEKAIVGIRDCPVKRATLCVTSDAEMEKCAKMRVALSAAFLSPRLACWRGHSARHCARAVADGSADLVPLDAADMLHAAAAHRLVPFMQEVYSSGEDWYYAVAVAKEQDPDTDLTYLRDKNTCHTGLGMAAGWVYPLAYLISNGWIRSYGCDGAHAAAQYFSKSCAPGALSAEYVDAGTVPHDNLCHLCHGASFRRCRRDASEEYFGHVGALRCMVEGGGDVAFVRHSAPAEVTAGRRREWWARDLLPDDLQLLCPDAPAGSKTDPTATLAAYHYACKTFFPLIHKYICGTGTRAKMHEYEHCNLGKIPGNVIMGRANHTELDTYSNLLIYAQQFYGAVTSDEFSFSMFYSLPPYSDLIFSDVAVRLKPLRHNKRSADIIAGRALIRANRIVSCDAPQAAYYLASDPDFLSNAFRHREFSFYITLALLMTVLLR